jgi:glycosyltransferase involved in cell wall biosynthesis
LLRFLGLINPGLWSLVRSGNYDAILILTGYFYLSFWIVALAAKLSGVPLMAGSDAYNLEGANPRWWKSVLKWFCLPFIYRLYRVLLVSSEATRRFVQSLGMPRERIALVPGGFDHEWWAREAGSSDRRETRARWGISDTSPVVLFCAKLTRRKRPQDALRAFARIQDATNSWLVVAGDGPMRSQLEAEADALGISKRVFFRGFVNQTQLPALFRAAELLVLSSEWDGCPLVVCEAMSCGCPVVLSDAIPGRFELVRHDDTGFIYPCGNVDALAVLLRQALLNPVQLKRLSTAAVERMQAWSIAVYVEGFVRVVMDQVVTVENQQLEEQEA